MNKSLPSSFFDRPTVKVVRDLLGCYLVRRRGGKTERHMITETEAYDGFKDMASHAFRGRTRRTEIMFGAHGYFYVYFTYGIHWMLNIVTGPKDYPAAVLIRGVAGIAGPARLTKALGITGALNGKRVGKSSGLWIEPRKIPVPKSAIEQTARIGIDYAGPMWTKKKWRFVLKKAPTSTIVS